MPVSLVCSSTFLSSPQCFDGRHASSRFSDRLDDERVQYTPRSFWRYRSSSLRSLPFFAPSLPLLSSILGLFALGRLELVSRSSEAFLGSREIRRFSIVNHARRNAAGYLESMYLGSRFDRRQGGGGGNRSSKILPSSNDHLLFSSSLPFSFVRSRSIRSLPLFQSCQQVSPQSLLYLFPR